MPNKFHRQNLRMGSNPFGRKSNLAKIAEVFGPKKKIKKVKKPTKRMMANVGGSADEKRDIRKVEQMIGKTISSKREKGRMKANVGGGADTGKVGEMKSKLALATDKAKKVMGKSIEGLTKEQIEKLKNIMGKKMKKNKEDVSFMNMAKGGMAKKKKKFPDMSGDGKVTMKDILMARGVIPKKKKNKKKVI